jgi:hypothetical protein
VNGERYGVRTDPSRVEAERDQSIVGSILGAAGVESHGQAVRVPLNTILTFRLEQPLEVGVPDRGFERDGWHYHYYGDGR